MARRWMSLFYVWFAACGNNSQSMPPQPDAPQPDTASLTVDPIRLLGDGRAKASLIVTLRDATGQPLAGRAVELTASGNGIVLGVTSAVTDQDGVVITSVSSTEGGASTVTARSEEIEVNADVTFDPVAPPCAGSPLMPFAPNIALGVVEVADLNGDGVPDLLGIDATLLRRDVAIGHGDGTFEQPIPGIPLVGRVLVVDIDVDGNLDLVSVDPGVAVTVHPGNGDGTFRSSLATATSSSSDVFAVGDFDGDSKPDIAIVTQGASTFVVAVLKGNGDGTFQGPVDTTISIPFTELVSTLSARDLDEDGQSDLVATATDTLARFAIANTDGTFQPMATIAVGYTPNGALVEDVDADGHVDFAVAGGVGTSELTIVRGRGDGTFDSGVPLALPEPPSKTIAVADLDHDGVLDVAVGLASGSMFMLAPGNGDGTFGVPIPLDGGQGLSPNFRIADFNGDGKLDLAADQVRLGTAVLLANGAAFGPPTFGLDILGTGTISVWETTIVDLDRDGEPDLAAAMSGPSGTVIGTFRGRGDMTFEAVTVVASAPTPRAALAVGDLDRDGDPDLVVLFEGNTSELVLYRNDGGLLGAPTNFPMGDLDPARFVAVADFDADSKLDVLLASSAKISVFRGDGAGGLGSATEEAIDIGPVTSVAVGDVDEDGLVDVALVGSSPPIGSKLVVLSGRGAGAFETPKLIDTGAPLLTIAIGDMDGDGHLDLTAVVRSFANFTSQLRFYFGSGSAGFSGPVQSAIGLMCPTLAVADVNRDGLLDLVGTGSEIGAAFGGAVSFGLGAGNFGASTVYPLLGTMGDLDHDGMLDSVANGRVARQSGCQP